MKTNIQNQIQKELQEFTENITIVGSWTFNQKKTIEQDILYYNSKFVDGDIDEEGFKLFFNNITRPTCGTTTKAIDIDTKDILLLTSPGGNSLKTWFYKRDLNYWFKKKNFGKTLNRICEELPVFGSVVLKKAGKGDVEFVNLKNFVCEQNADTLDQSNYIIEQHYYTPVEFQRIGKEKGWKNIDEVLKLYNGSREQYIRVFERYGMIEDDNGEFNYEMVLVADIPSDVKRNKQTENEIYGNLILGEKKVEKHPYFEIHIFKIPGRWLGFSIPELLEDPQIRINEITNQEARSSYWSALRLWFSTDDGIKRNLLRSVSDGDILDTDNIQAVPMEDRNTYVTYQAQKEQWKQNAQELTFSYDVVRGARMPAGTPLGSAQLSAAMSISYFDQIKENVSLDIKKLLYEYILPSFKETSNKAHIIRISGEDLDKLVELEVESNARKKWFEYIMKNNRVPPQELIDTIKEVNRSALLKKGGELMVGIEAGWFDDVMYDIEIVITDESMDTATQALNLVQALQTITQNPNVLQDPTQKRIFAKYLEAGGINLNDIEANIPRTTQMPMEVQPVGGGISGLGKQQTNIKNKEIKL